MKENEAHQKAYNHFFKIKIPRSHHKKKPCTNHVAKAVMRFSRWWCDKVSGAQHRREGVVRVVVFPVGVG